MKLARISNEINSSVNPSGANDEVGVTGSRNFAKFEDNFAKRETKNFSQPPYFEVMHRDGL